MVYISARYSRDTFPGFDDEVITLAELEGTGGTSSDTGWLESRTLSVSAKGTLAYPWHRLIPFEVWYSKGTGYLTVAATDALVIIIGHRSIWPLLQSADNASFYASRVLTVHALKLVKDPIELAILFHFGKVYLGKSAGR